MQKSGNANGVNPYESQLTYTIEPQLFGGYSVGTLLVMEAIQIHT